VRASRLLSVLLLLQARGRMTARELASELEVSVRTIYRDVESLHEAGVPLYGDAGHAGGYQLLGGYRTTLTGLTGGEAGAVFLAALPGVAADLGLGEVATTARRKLLAALPTEQRARADQEAGWFHLDTAGWYRDGAAPAALPAIAAAVREQHCVRVRYRRWQAPREVSRTLKPYGLVLKAGEWYVVARGRGRVGTYKVGHVLTVEPTGARFRRPVGFDLGAHWAASLADFDARRHSGEEAVLALTPRGLRRVPDYLGPALAAAVAATATPQEDGRFRAVIPMEAVDSTLAVLLKLGAEVEVLAPDALRAAFARTARELAGRYARSADSRCQGSVASVRS
jgi:predicted DNA-binding transcriptional regulator YafY